MKETNSKSITQYLDTEYAQFGKYTIENRAIPSLIDGFKPTQRKIIFVSNKIWKTLNEKPLKVFQLGGRIAAEAMYHHGNPGGSIINMAQDFKNSIPLLDGIGQFGSLRATEAGAERYVAVKLNSNFRSIYKDFELLEYKEEEGYEIEPVWFLPIIPTVILNGSSGIAVGFATNILNRNPIEVVDSCIASLDGKKFKEPLPWWKDFNGEIVKADGDGSTFTFKGKFEVLNTTTVKVTELPPSMTYTKYENHLNNLQEKGHISYYDDNSKGSNLEYIIKFSRNDLSNRIQKSQLETLLKLIEHESENITCLDEKNKIIKFDNVTDLINYFVKFRLTFYEKRKKFLLSELDKNWVLLSNRAKFLKSIIDGKLKVNNRPKSDLVDDIEKLKLDKINDSYDYLLNMSIYSLTKERYENILTEINQNREEFMQINKLNTSDMYKSDLLELKKKIKNTKS